VDREALDEEVHNLDFLVDSARRICHLARLGQKAMLRLKRRMVDGGGLRMVGKMGG